MTPILEGKKIACFDLEIKKSIDQCSKGWQSHDEMGISCLCLYDYHTGRYRVFDDNNKEECISILCEYDLIVGFNTVNFDWQVVKHTWIWPKEGPNHDLAVKFDSRVSKNFDILREIWKSLNLNPDVFVGKTHGGYKLDDVAFETIGFRKTGDGALAPKLFQTGRIADLIDYCLEDVRIEKTLFEFIVKNGYITRNGNKILIKYEN